jgi:hypothetical protein
MSKHLDKNKRKQLSADELRKYAGFENVADEQANEVISVVEQLARLMYELYINQKIPKSEKQTKASK